MEINTEDLEDLFNLLPNTVFFIKNKDCCYTQINTTLMRRLGIKDRAEIIGRRAEELFPLYLGRSYSLQDKRVLNGEVINNQLELHLFPNHKTGWCLTYKRPLMDNGRIIGLIGISHDLGCPATQHPIYDRLNKTLNYIRAHYSENLQISTLARQTGLSVAQLERHCLHVFQLTPRQLLIKVRVESAIRMLRTKNRIADISFACGYSDQSAFTRQFKAQVGMTPGHYRGTHRSDIDLARSSQRDFS